MSAEKNVNYVIKRAGIFLLTVLMMTIFAFPVYAAPEIKDVEYEGKGKVEVEFRSKDVQYRKLKVTVKDSSGKTYKVRILGKERDDVDFRIVGYKAGTTYKFTIKGVRRKGEKKYSSLKGKVWIPIGCKLTG